MTLPSGTPTAELSAIAHQEFMKDVPDLFTYANHLFYLMTKNKEYVDGGTFIQQPVDYQELPNKGFITGTSADTLNLNVSPMLTYATFNWKYFYHAIGFTLQDFTVTANTKNAIASLMEKKLKQAKGTVTRTLTAAMHASASSDSNSFNGLADIFAGTGTSYGGLLDTELGNDQNGDAIWLASRDTSTTTCNYTNISGKIDTLKGRAQQQGGGGTSYKLDTMISNSTVYNNFKKAEQLKQRFQNVQKLESGFSGLEVDGVMWTIDEFAAANTLYLITSESMKLCYKYGLDKQSPFDEAELVIPNQPVTAQRAFFVGNMVCSNRRVNGIFTGLSA